MYTWEYKILKDWQEGNPDSVFDLNELGKERWELITFRMAPGLGNVWYFKRRVKISKKWPVKRKLCQKLYNKKGECCASNNRN